MTRGEEFKKPKKKNFRCEGYPGCSMSFSRAEHLARHIRRHTGEKPFKCDICLKFFSRIDNLKQHRDTVHAVDNVRHTRAEAAGPEAGASAAAADAAAPGTGTGTGTGTATFSAANAGGNARHKKNNVNKNKQDSGKKTKGLKEDRKRSYLSDGFSSSSSSPSNSETYFSAGIKGNGNGSGASSNSHSSNSSVGGNNKNSGLKSEFAKRSQGNDYMGNGKFGKYWSPPVLMGPVGYEENKGEPRTFNMYSNFPSERNQRFKQSFSRKSHDKNLDEDRDTPRGSNVFGAMMQLDDSSRPVPAVSESHLNTTSQQQHDFVSGNRAIPHIADFYRKNKGAAPFLSNRLPMPDPEAGMSRNTDNNDKYNDYNTKASPTHGYVGMSPPYLIPSNNDPLMVPSFSTRNDTHMRTPSNGSGIPNTMITATTTITRDDDPKDATRPIIIKNSKSFTTNKLPPLKNLYEE